MSAWWSSALVAAVARSACAPISKPSPRIPPDQLVDPVGRQRLIEPAGAVVPDRAEQRAVLVRAVASGLEVIVDQPVGARMQRQIPGFLALAGDLHVRNATPRLPEVPDFQFAQLVAPQRVIEQRREDGAVALVLDRVLGRRGQEIAAWWSPIAGVLPSPLSARGRLTPLTGL